MCICVRCTQFYLVEPSLAIKIQDYVTRGVKICSWESQLHFIDLIEKEMISRVLVVCYEQRFIVRFASNTTFFVYAISVTLWILLHLEKASCLLILNSSTRASGGAFEV